MKMKRVVATLLTMVLLLSALPLTAGAADSAYIGGSKTENGLGLTKTAVLQPDGTYTITLEAFATGETVTTMSTEGVPMDIALVLDQSGSMMEPIDTTAVDLNDPTVQENGKTIGFYMAYYDHDNNSSTEVVETAVRYYEGKWQFNKTPRETSQSWANMSSGNVYKSRLGALTEALHGFVNTVLEDTYAYDEPVDHRVAIIGYSFGAASNSNSVGFVSPGSETDQINKGFVNTGVFVDGVLQNYGVSNYVGPEDYDPETYLTHGYKDSNGSYYYAYYCDDCKAWYTEQHYDQSNWLGGTEHVTAGSKRTPKSSESATSGYQFYDIVRQTPENFQAALVSANDGSNNLNASIATAISNIGAYGATNVGYGIEMAKNLFYYNPIPEGEARKRVVVVFSDGTCESDNIQMAVDSAAELKTVPYSAEIFTVGLYGSGEETDAATNFMHAISSNYPEASYNGSSYTLGGADLLPVYELDATGTYYVIDTDPDDGNLYYYSITYSNGNWYKAADNTLVKIKSSSDDTTSGAYQAYMSHYLTASNTIALKNIFTSIVSQSTNYTPSVELDASSILTDVLNPGLFKLGAGYTVTVQTQIMKTTDGKTYTTVGDPKNFTGDVTVDTDKNSIQVKGFDYSTKFVSTGHNGEKLIVTITGVVGLDAAATGKPEFTNDVSASGIFHGGLPVSLFPEPTGLIPCKNYVLDYSKPIAIQVAALGLERMLDVGATMDRIDGTVNGLDLTYGSIAQSGSDLRYTPETMNWRGYDSFYVFGQKSDGTYAWVKVSVLPANNVYFEDDFITTTDGKTVGIVYSGDWTVNGTASGNTETPNGPVHGWEAGLSNNKGYSDGSAHVSSTAGASATFTFTGTGVDVYSRTNMETGMIIAIVTKDGETVANMALMVDNLAASGDYYQVPTLSIHTVYDSATDKEIAMPYGTYTVTLYVSDAYTVDQDGNVVLNGEGEPEKRSTYYLDGVRVYNPLEIGDDPIAGGAYGEEELNASFAEIRDLLIDAKSFGETDDGSTSANTATLVTDASTLKIGDQIIIVAKDDDVALSTNQKDNNRGQAEVTKDGNTVTFGADTQIITLVGGTHETTFGFQVDGSYLYAASSSYNYLRTQADLDENGSWTISITADGAATIIAQGTNTRNTMRYNSSSKLFACYALDNSQKDLCIYKIENTESTGMVFIDQLEDKTTGQITNDVGVYKDYGPKNEVYLAAGQSIAFHVDTSATMYFYVGLKSLTGADVTVKYSGSDGEQTISHSTDLYYKLTPDANGYIVIQNTSGGILALTKLRTTGPEADNSVQLLPMSQNEAQVVVYAFSNNFVQKPIEYVWLDNMVAELFKSLDTWFQE